MKFKVKEGMSNGVISVEEGENLLAAYKKMHANRIRHLPVVNHEGNIVGILSDRDINRAMQSHIVKSKNKKTSEDIDFDPKACVEDYMSWPVKTFNKDRLLKDVAKEMIREKISALLVTDQMNDIVGIITTEDLLRVLIEFLEGPEPVHAWNLESILKAPFQQVFA
jgi:acetoin utilization protein AcuB